MPGGVSSVIDHRYHAYAISTNAKTRPPGFPALARIPAIDHVFREISWSNAQVLGKAWTGDRTGWRILNTRDVGRALTPHHRHDAVAEQ